MNKDGNKMLNSNAVYFSIFKLAADSIVNICSVHFKAVTFTEMNNKNTKQSDAALTSFASKMEKT